MRRSPLAPFLFSALGCAGTAADSGGPDVDGFSFGPVQSCDAPADAVSYTESAAAWGLAGRDDPSADHQEGGSVAVLDVDLDGRLDLLIAHPQQGLSVWLQDDAGFVESRLDGVWDPWLLSLGDWDQDGILDLAVGGPDPSLWRGDGSGFTRMDLPDLELLGFASVAKYFAPTDLDGDGHTDLYAVVNAAGEAPTDDELADRVLWGDGQGGFTVDTAAVPSAGARRGFDATPIDLGGEPGLYVANDMGPDFGGNVLFQAGSRTLADLSDSCFCDIEHSAMGVDAGDWDGDGREDLYVAATPENVLYSALPDGSFADYAAAAGAEGIAETWGMSWGASFVDHDNDGDLDILDAQGDQWSADGPTGVEGVNLLMPQPIWLLVQEDGVFTEQGGALGLATEGSFRSAVGVEINGDGVPDLVVTDVVDRPHLYLSDSCTSAAWLEVAVPFDSKVEVEAQGRTFTGWARAHAGYGGARLPRVHVGLGDATQVDRLTVTLPTGEHLEVDEPFAPRRIVGVAAAPTGTLP